VSIGEEQRVVLEGPEEYLNKIEAEFDDGILRLTEKTSGVFPRFLGKARNKSVNLYLKLTSADQLIQPTKGKLITNESTFNFLIDNQQQLSLNQHLRGILQLVGHQTGFILMNSL
jgi:hypothetical protein